MYNKKVMKFAPTKNTSYSIHIVRKALSLSAVALALRLIPEIKRIWIILITDYD